MNNDIYEILNKDEIFNKEEIKQLNESIEVLIKEYLTDNINNIIYPNFEKNINDYICNIYLEQLLSTYGDEFKFIIIKFIKKRKIIVFID